MFAGLFMCLALSFGAGTIVQGATYNVKIDGSADFSSIQDCVDLLQPGDECIVHAGEYNERVSFPQSVSGTQEARITVRAEPPLSVTMYGFHVANADYLTIQGFRITGPDSVGRTEAGILIKTNGVDVIDNYFFDIRERAIEGDTGNPESSNVRIIGNRIYRCQMGIIARGQNWLVEGNEVSRLYQWDLSNDSDYARFFGENIVFRSNYFHGTSFAETGDAHVDGFQTFAINGEIANNILIEKNRVFDFNQGVIINEGPSLGNITIRNNVFANGTSWGVIAVNSPNLTVVHNVFANIDIHGVGFLNGTTGRVQNNIFYRTLDSSYFKDPSSSILGGFNIVYESPIPEAGTSGDLIGVDPMFMSAAGGDFRLFSLSPALDAGLDVGVLTDLVGALRPQGPGFDIGPYEGFAVGN